nr:uncharacterized protein LOC127327023 isoform X1 [Lolium perenne]XP_051209761.1 uncharacterized protein LOC127327023 isoform X1 [Lolium perenne]
MAGVSAQPWGPWGLEPQDPWIWTAHRLGRLLTPRVGAWTTVAATLLWPMKLSSERTCSSCDRKSRAQLSPTRKAQLRREPLLWSTGWMPRLHPCPPAGGLAIQVLSPVPVKFKGNTNLALYTTAMIAAGANEKIMVNWFPMALKGMTLSWLMHLPKESIVPGVSFAFASSAHSRPWFSPHVS